jgi:hypothetical protein
MAELITPFKPTVVEALETVIAYEALAISGKYNVSEAVIEFVQQLDAYQPTQITARVDGTITLNFSSPVPESVLNNIKFIGDIRTSLASKFKISSARVLVDGEPTFLPPGYIGSTWNLILQANALGELNAARNLAASPSDGSEIYLYKLPTLASLDTIYLAFGIQSLGKQKTLTSISFSSQIQ